jgi:signal transduction histidine kinase
MPKLDFKEEDRYRRKIILLIIIYLSLLLSGSVLLIKLIFLSLFNYHYGFSVWGLAGIFILLLSALCLAKKDRIELASYVLIIIYFAVNLIFIYLWGINFPANLLLQGLCITLAGILFNSRAIIIASMIVCFEIIIFTGLQLEDLAQPFHNWRREETLLGDAFAYALVFTIVPSLAWLSIKRSERYRLEAETYENNLKKERDSFEDKFKERSLQLKLAQTEKISQLYRFCEFGKLSSGLFHDLINPLTAVSLNLQQIKQHDPQADNAGLDQALAAAAKMEEFILSIKKQIKKESTDTIFTPAEEIKQIIALLSYRSRHNHLKLRYKLDQNIKLFGDSLKFGQIILNLIVNAHDAIPESTTGQITIKLQHSCRQAYFIVKDNGSGINPDIMDKIFEPFFSTKDKDNGLGIGLSSSRDIARKYFNGDLKAANRHGGGACFIFNFPLNSQ